MDLVAPSHPAPPRQGTGRVAGSRARGTPTALAGLALTKFGPGSSSVDSHLLCTVLRCTPKISPRFDLNFILGISNLK